MAATSSPLLIVSGPLNTAQSSACGPEIARNTGPERPQYQKEYLSQIGSGQAFTDHHGGWGGRTPTTHILDLTRPKSEQLWEGGETGPPT